MIFRYYFVQNLSVPTTLLFPTCDCAEIGKHMWCQLPPAMRWPTERRALYIVKPEPQETAPTNILPLFPINQRFFLDATCHLGVRECTWKCSPGGSNPPIIYVWRPIVFNTSVPMWDQFLWRQMILWGWKSQALVLMDCEILGKSQLLSALVCSPTR